MSINVAFPFLSGSVYVKPNKHDKEKYPTLSEQYYTDFAKWALYNANETRHTKWLHNINTNKEFYKGNQWDLKEDIDNFLMDDSGQLRNRIKVVINQIRPMVEQYRGNAIRLAIGATAKSISKNAKVRKEEALKNALFTQDVTGEFKDIGAVVRGQNPDIQETAQEQEEIFNNVYVDKYAKNINRLIEFSSEYNDMEEFQVKIAENLAFSGLGTIEEYKHGEHLRKEVVEPEEYFWDRNAKRPDHQDGAYMGRIHMMTLPDIFERWQGVKLEDRQALEKYVAGDSSLNNTYSPDQNNSNIGNSVPVYKIFFMDDQTKLYGYVEDEFGLPYFVALNEEDEFSDGKVYTEADLIDPPDTNENKKMFKNGKKTRKVVTGVVRSCFFIPGEAVNYTTRDTNGKDVRHDIMLEYGPYEYQETNWMDLSRNRYPLKSYCWAYISGEVLSPIDDVINPQRFMNRIMSATESQVNNSGGAGIVYDKDMIDNEADEIEILKNANAGKPIAIRTRGKGVPNTVGTYDNTIKSGTYNMFGLLPTIKTLMNDITGVNEGLRGESTGSDQLVGVTELLIQRGSLMQEPFYNAMARIFVQSHQSTATVGKQIYIDNQRELNSIIGDEGVDVFKLAEGMRNEDFRVFVTRSASPEQMRQQADGVLSALLQAQMIDQKFYADMVGRSTVDEIHSKLREEVNKKMVAQRKAAEEQAAAQEQAVTQQAQQQQNSIEQAKIAENEIQSLELAKDQGDKQHELESIALKGAIAGASKSK